MIVYWILLLITAFIAYCMGSLDSVVLASNFVFRRDLRKLGKGNIAFSNFRRIFGPKGFVKLLLVELVKDLLPILIGGWLLGTWAGPLPASALCWAGSIPPFTASGAATESSACWWPP